MRLPATPLRTLLPGRVRPVLELGPTLNYAVRLDATTVMVDYFNRSRTGVLLNGNYHRFQEGLMGGVGLDFPYWQTRRLAVLARAEADTGWTSGLDTNSEAVRFYALLAFDLTQ